MDKFLEMVSGKNVLFVPTYSMRSYETGKYDLSADGNFARVLSFVKNSNCGYVTVTVPKLNMLKDGTVDYLYDLVAGHDMSFAPINGYGANANGTRFSHELFKEVVPIAYTYDLIVIEQEQLALDLIHSRKVDNSKLVFWCVASHVKGHEIWFVDGHKHLDKLIASEIPTVCANEKQVEWLGGKSFVGFFYDVRGAFKPTVFFPFRLSDPEYHFYDKLIRFLDVIQETSGDAYDLLLTDPNESLDMSRIGHQRPLVVSNNHALYMAVLKGKPIVPYFAEVDVIRHISIEEMVQAGCCIITYENETYDMMPNVHMADDDEEFIRLLKHAIETEGR